MSAQQEVVTAQLMPKRISLVETFADRYGIESNRMMATLRATVIRPASNGTEATNEQIAAFLIVANQHELNPFTKEIHAFLDKRGGIVTVVGLDGWAKKINEHPEFDGMTFEQDDEKCTCTMYRKDRKHPTVHTEWLMECKRDTEPWRTHPKRMLNWKALIQTARITFSFAGIYDPDEAEGIVAAIDAEVVGEEGAERDTNFGTAKISPVKMREICEGAIAAASKGDAVALWTVWGPLSNAEIELVWKQLRSYERTAIKKLQTSNAYKIAESGLDIPAWSISALQAAKDPEAVDKAYAVIEELYAEHDQEVPLDIQTVRSDRKTELGA